MKTQLMDILQYYKDTYSVEDSLEDIYDDLIANGVEVRGSSFYCEVVDKDSGAIVLLAGTKESADMWVMKKIVRLIKSGKTIYSLLNGNSEYLLSVLSRYNVKVVDCKNDITYIMFNGGE